MAATNSIPELPKPPRKRRPKVAGGRVRKGLKLNVEPATVDKLRALADATGLSQSMILELVMDNFEARWKEAEESSGGERAVATRTLLDRLRRTIDTSVKSDRAPRTPDDSSG
ncbi:MAG TPA: hypothetical protein VK510_03180 [Solirubrobacteraceae bacterium]|nr:hypothetical protein [Solirubrobacteraceae bacterium]